MFSYSNLASAKELSLALGRDVGVRKMLTDASNYNTLLFSIFRHLKRRNQVSAFQVAKVND